MLRKQTRNVLTLLLQAELEVVTGKGGRRDPGLFDLLQLLRGLRPSNPQGSERAAGSVQVRLNVDAILREEVLAFIEHRSLFDAHKMRIVRSAVLENALARAAAPRLCAWFVIGRLLMSPGTSTPPEAGIAAPHSQKDLLAATRLCTLRWTLGDHQLRASPAAHSLQNAGSKMAGSCTTREASRDNDARCSLCTCL